MGRWDGEGGEGRGKYLEGVMQNRPAYIPSRRGGKKKGKNTSKIIHG